MCGFFGVRPNRVRLASRDSSMRSMALPTLRQDARIMCPPTKHYLWHVLYTRRQKTVRSFVDGPFGNSKAWIDTEQRNHPATTFLITLRRLLLNITIVWSTSFYVEWPTRSIPPAFGGCPISILFFHGIWLETFCFCFGYILCYSNDYDFCCSTTTFDWT